MGHLRTSRSPRAARRPQRPRTLILSAVAATATLLSPHPAPGIVRSWTTSSSGSWNSFVNWSGFTVPVAGDSAFVTLAPISNLNLTYNGSYSALAPLDQFLLDSPNTFTLTFLQNNAANNLYTTSETIGNGGRATYTQSAATHAVTSSLILAANAGSTAAYSLSGTGSLSSSTQYVGRAGAASFSQSAGANTLSSSLFLGYNNTGTGSYSLTGGSLSVGEDEYLGFSGVASFNQSGGTHSVAGTLNLGFAGPAINSYSLSGGSLSTFYEYVGLSGNASFTQSAGTHAVTLQLYIGANPGSTGSYSLSGGSLSAPSAYVGYSGSGAITHSAGTLVSNGLFLGHLPGSTGTYSLSNSASLSTQFERIGLAGSASFTQSAGSHSVSDNVVVGFNAGSTGSYSLTGGSFSVGNALSLGSTTTTLAGGIGNLSISGGAASVVNLLQVWPGSRLTLTGGSLSAGSLSLANSAFDLSGGTFSAPLATQSAADFRNDLLAGRIFSLAALADPLHRLAVGYITSATTLTARLTYLGDANLDGRVTPDDFALLDRGYAKHLSTWQDGDFNYDGQITPADYLLLDSTYAKQQGGNLSPDFLATRHSQFGPDYVSTLLTTIPEPVMPAALILLSFSFTRHRRRAI